MADIAKMKAANAARWSRMHVNASRLPDFQATAKRLCAPFAKSMYQKISAATGVPWFVVAVIHEREAGGPPHWDKHLGQGDPLSRKTVHEPAGRGPFFGEDAFYRGALDALIDCAPHAAKWKDWTIGGALTILEEYNGIGYFLRGVPSAYVWSGSDQYVSGKFVADHVYSANAIDVQEGCAPLIACMAAIDKSVVLGDAPAKPALPPLPPPPDIPAREQNTIPQPDIPARESGRGLIDFIISLFKRK